MDLKEIKRLIQLVQKSGIGELEVTEGGRTIRIATQSSVQAHGPVSYVVGSPAVAPLPAPSAGATAAPGTTAGEAPGRAAESHLVPIVSPMVGTFYRSPAPDADPYVELNSQVEIGQTVCIIEAMKLMNEIESESRGRIVRILVENAQPVEYGQTLFLVDPS
ncbi:MAG: acetyl-CoA carboxylase biotin carboxyl carrier protein [Candidatus Eiseniibacteriota bacterium]